MYQKQTRFKVQVPGVQIVKKCKNIHYAYSTASDSRKYNIYTHFDFKVQELKIMTKVHYRNNSVDPQAQKRAAVRCDSQ